MNKKYYDVTIFDHSNENWSFTDSDTSNTGYTAFTQIGGDFNLTYEEDETTYHLFIPYHAVEMVTWEISEEPVNYEDDLCVGLCEKPVLELGTPDGWHYMSGEGDQNAFDYVIDPDEGAEVTAYVEGHSDIEVSVDTPYGSSDTGTIEVLCPIEHYSEPPASITVVVTATVNGCSNTQKITIISEA